MAGLKVYTIAYQIKVPKINEFYALRFAEVAACNVEAAKELFFRNHNKSSKIVQIKIKRKAILK